MKRPIILVPKDNGKELSPEQKKFLSWQKKTDLLLQKMEDFRAAEAFFSQKYLEKILPEMEKMDENRARWIEDTADFLSQQKIAKHKRNEIIGLMLIYLENLIYLEKFGYLREIYNEFSPTGWIEEEADDLEMNGENMDSGDDEEMDSEEEEDFYEKIDEFFKQFMEDAGLGNAAQYRRTRPKSAAAEKRKKAEEQKMIKSLREIYIELVKEFHPDRVEGEAEKAQKTAIMQRITEAYERKDLLELFRLQMEFLHFDADELSQTPKEKMNLYNKAMGSRYANLEAEFETMQIKAIHQYRNLRINFSNTKNAEGAVREILREINLQNHKIEDQRRLCRQKVYHKQFINVLLEEADMVRYQ